MERKKEKEIPWIDGEKRRRLSGRGSGRLTTPCLACGAEFVHTPHPLLFVMCVCVCRSNRIDSGSAQRELELRERERDLKVPKGIGGKRRWKMERGEELGSR